MAPDSFFPTLSGDLLDHYLGLGYYRMGQNLFTCRFLPLGPDLHTVHWLRLVLAQVVYGSKQRRLFRLNERFEVTIRPFRLAAEYEDLYARYYQTLDFDTAASLEALLLDGAARTVFATGVVEVRDGNQLIAAGIFDSGADSIAGIVNFFDPAYRQHSLGKYLLLLKAEHARRRQLTYYYPGYLVNGNPKFDYKLFACPAATEVFDCHTSHWLPFSWEEVQRQSARLLADEAADDLDDEG